MVEIEERAAQLLRQLRLKKGLTLKECEVESEGRFKAVVLGSYERGTRAISLQRLQELADFYEVPIQYFFEVGELGALPRASRHTFDLRKLRGSLHMDEKFDLVAKMLVFFARQRGDWNGEVLSIRASDAALLPILSEDIEIIEKLRLYKLILVKPD
jgi:transcriptional regulator with XRE-family HTH domain